MTPTTPSPISDQAAGMGAAIGERARLSDKQIIEMASHWFDVGATGWSNVIVFALEIIAADRSTAPTTGSAPEINQCDGCRVNAPLTERYGNHAMPDGRFMACTKDRYAAPTQGADGESLRPVAIYQVRARGDDKWRDVLEGVYDSCHRLHSHKFETRIVHESLPSDCEPVGEIVTFGKDPEVKEVSWAKGKMPSVGTKLYATRNAAPKDSNRARGASIPQHEIAYALHVASGRTKSIVACHAIVNAALATRDAAPK